MNDFVGKESENMRKFLANISVSKNLIDVRNLYLLNSILDNRS